MHQGTEVFLKLPSYNMNILSESHPQNPQCSNTSASFDTRYLIHIHLSTLGITLYEPRTRLGHTGLGKWQAGIMV